MFAVRIAAKKELGKNLGGHGQRKGTNRPAAFPELLPASRRFDQWAASDFK